MISKITPVPQQRQLSLGTAEDGFSNAISTIDQLDKMLTASPSHSPAGKKEKEGGSKTQRGHNTGKYLQVKQFDYSERMVKQINSKGNIDSQIEYLFKDYLRQKEAYNAVVGMYGGVLNPISEEKSSRLIEDEIEQNLLKEIAADLENKTNLTLCTECCNNANIVDGSTKSRGPSQVMNTCNCANRLATASQANS